MIGEDHKANDSDPTHPTVWKCPGVSIIKINFDDSVMSQNNIGMDMVARDHNDLMLAGATWTVPTVFEPRIAKLIKILLIFLLVHFKKPNRHSISTLLRVVMKAMALSFAASTPLALEEEPLPHTDDDCDVNNDDDAFFGIVSLDDKGFP
ncbi:hypothetical protein JHK84_053112 [Glycine max]|nr:hypothetical protein JHK84_053112 [Glycine max]